MAADLVPIRLAVTDGDRYTLWAPSWRESGDEWQAFLGRDDVSAQVYVAFYERVLRAETEVVDLVSE